MIDHVEVVLGPGSVVYGSNAMLGVINVITKQAKDWSGFHLAAETEFGKSYRALGGVGATEFQALGKRATLTLGLEYYTHDGPPMIYDFAVTGIDTASFQPYKYRRDGPANGIWGGLAKNAYYTRVPSGFLRLSWGDFELNVSAKTYKRAFPYRSRYKDDFIDFDDPDSYEIDRHLWVDLTHRARLSPIVLVTSRFYADSFEYESFRNSSEASACLIFNVTAINKTQPDQVDPAAPAAGAGAPYTFSVNATTKRVDTCRDKNGAVVTLTTCLAAAAYSSYFRFATDRVIIK
jgi:outer membrane receptor protein involved in Fe transport